MTTQIRIDHTTVRVRGDRGCARIMYAGAVIGAAPMDDCPGRAAQHAPSPGFHRRHHLMRLRRGGEIDLHLRNAETVALGTGFQTVGRIGSPGQNRPIVA